VSAAQVLVRRLSPAQAETRRRLIEAARELASEGGYDAVGIRSVAKRAGLSAPTAYQYFASKDHLLVDSMVGLVGDTTSAIEARPSRAGSALERTVATLRRVMRRVEKEPNLYVAMMRAYISGTPEVVHARAAMETSMRSWIAAALGSTEVEDREDVIAILESVLFAGMVGLVTGTRAPADIANQLERAVRVLWKR
jgi:TetR/AcrR family transcriptional regulator, cholesterol catabolism regulator